MEVKGYNEGVPQIAQQMPSVSNLQGVWCPLTCAFRVISTSVSTNDPDVGLGLKPRSEGRDLRIGQKVKHAVALQVDEQRSIAFTPAKCPVIDTQDFNRGRRRQLTPAYQAQLSTTTGCQPEMAGNPCSGLSSELKTKMG